MSNKKELLDIVVKRLDEGKLPLPKDVSNLAIAFFAELDAVSRIVYDNEKAFCDVMGASGEYRDDLMHDFHQACDTFMGLKGFMTSCHDVLQRTVALVDDGTDTLMRETLGTLKFSIQYWNNGNHIDLLNEPDSSNEIDKIADQFLVAFTEAKRICHASFQASSFLSSVLGNYSTSEPKPGLR